MKHLSLDDFDAVAFDLEGTLADTIPTHHASRMRAFAEHGMAHITPEQHAKGPLYGSTPPAIIGGVLREAGALDAQGDLETHPLVTAIIATKMRYFGEFAAQGFAEMPGAIAFFTAIAKHFGDKTALVTASSLAFVTPFVERYHLESMLTPEHIITEDTITQHGLQPKPAPDGYLLAKKHMHAKKLLVFEDTTSGLVAAKAAGATVVAVGFEPHNTARFLSGQPEYTPDYFVQSYPEARALFGLPA